MDIVLIIALAFVSGVFVISVIHNNLSGWRSYLKLIAKAITLLFLWSYIILAINNGDIVKTRTYEIYSHYNQEEGKIIQCIYDEDNNVVNITKIFGYIIDVDRYNGIEAKYSKGWSYGIYVTKSSTKYNPVLKEDICFE